jgi:hypothetical protein
MSLREYVDVEMREKLQAYMFEEDDRSMLADYFDSIHDFIRMEINVLTHPETRAFA